MVREVQPNEKIFDAAGGDITNLSTVDVLSKAYENLGPSAGKALDDFVQPFLSPIETAKSLYDLGSGIISLAIPGEQPSEKYARAVGEYYANRYGSIENVKQTAALDPVGLLLDISTVLTLGGGAVARAPSVAGQLGRAVQSVEPLAKAVDAAKALPSSISNPRVLAAANALGQAATKAPDVIEKFGRAAQSVDPLAGAIAAARKLPPSVRNAPGRAVATLIGDVATRTGADSVLQAYRAGRTGGETLRAFQDALRGNAPISEVVDQARMAVRNLKTQKNRQYQASKDKLTKDKTILDFDSIDAAIDKVNEVGSFKGVDLEPSAKQVKSNIKQIVDDWKKLDPETYHTPMGIDALKQKIRNSVGDEPYGSQSRFIADRVYNAVSDRIKIEAPEYSKMMRDYENAVSQINDIENTLSIKPTANVDTSVRKLQSIFRNNANTDYGRRAELGNVLEDAGARTLLPSLAGQSMSSAVPRGIAGSFMPAAQMGAAALTQNPLPLAALPFQSPRLMGEAASAAGRLAGAVNRLGPRAPQAIGLGLYQAGLLGDPNLID